MTDFVMDKIGYYGADNGQNYRVVYKINPDNFVYLDKDSVAHNICSNGIGPDFKINHYFGENIPREPLVYKFTGVIKYDVRNFIQNEFTITYPQVGVNFSENTLWEIVMKEVVK